MMHKEIKQSKKTVGLIISLLTITLSLYIYKFFKMNFGKNIAIEFTVEIILILITLLVLINEIRKCKISYKYSLISDKLIINKMTSKVEENVESLKIKDILYIGDKTNVPKEYIKYKCSKHYIRRFDKSKKFICVYKKENKICKFKFEPSDILLSRVKNLI